MATKLAPHRQATPVALETRRISFSYGEFRLQPMNFSVRRGETMCVLGGSGVGKSTILKLILHLEEPDSGHVEVLGHDLETSGRAEIFEARRLCRDFDQVAVRGIVARANLVLHVLPHGVVQHRSEDGTVR